MSIGVWSRGSAAHPLKTKAGFVEWNQWARHDNVAGLAGIIPCEAD
jgi:hypothetical protein